MDIFYVLILLCNLFAAGAAPALTPEATCAAFPSRIQPAYLEDGGAMPMRISARPSAVRLILGGVCSIAIVGYVAFRVIQRPELRETPVAIIQPINATAIGNEHLTIEESIRQAIERHNSGINVLNNQQFAAVAAPTLHAIVNADWNALVASLGSFPLQHDAEMAALLRKKWMLLPPRHRPANLGSLTDLEILSLRSKDTQPLAFVDMSRIGVRVYDVRDREQVAEAQSEFARRYGFMFAGEGSNITVSGGIPLRPAGLPPLEESANSVVAAVDVPGKTSQGAFVVLTVRFLYSEPFGWVPILVETVTRRTPSAPQPYSPRI